MEGDDFIYLTYDISDNSKLVGARVYTVGSVQYHLDWGYVDEGEFHTVYSEDINSGSNFSCWAERTEL